MSAKVVTPVLVVYDAEQISTGDRFTCNDTYYVDSFPITQEQLLSIRNAICENKGMRKLIFHNIIPLRQKQVKAQN